MELCTTCCAPTAVSPCQLCRDPKRDHSTICVVEDFSDLLAIEATGTYHGLYHVLHGALNPINGIGPDELRFHELFARLQHAQVKELILALKANTNGEATATYTSHAARLRGIHSLRRH